MADNKKAPIIIIKKKGGGHGGHHGGAWKVAYADFVTAMMAFFLVMWLLGSDEEIKAAVAHYFNNPTSVWRPDLSSSKNVPLGDMTGAGENVLNGADGMVPEDLVERPSRTMTPTVQNQPMKSLIRNFINDETLSNLALNIDALKISVEEERLFKNESDEFKAEAKVYLKNLEHVVKDYKGFLTVKGNVHTQSGEKPSDKEYAFETTRMVAIKKFLVSRKLIDENRITTEIRVKSLKAGETPGSVPDSVRRVEFIFTHGSRG